MLSEENPAVFFSPYQPFVKRINRKSRVFVDTLFDKAEICSAQVTHNALQRQKSKQSTRANN
jgi:hypothetical protein